MTNDNRAERFYGRAILSRITSVPRCRDCGTRSMLPGGTVGVRYNEGRAGFAGLGTCGSVLLCPVCNAKIMARRSIEIGLVLLWAQANNLHVIWGALTCRHTVNDPLEALLDLQANGWHDVVNSRSWRDESVTVRVPHLEHGKRCPWVCAFDHDVHDSGCEWHCTRVHDYVDTGGRGRVGYIRAFELNTGANGWHPHFHPIVLFRGTREEADWHAADIVSDWVYGIEKYGGEALKVGANGMRVLDDVKVWDWLMNYTTKATYTVSKPDAKKLALEMVWSQSKNGSRRRFAETQSHWALLDLAGSTGDVGQWEELEEAVKTKRRRVISWSRGLRDFAGLGEEATDDTLAAEEVGTTEDTVAVITAAGWQSLKGRPDVQALMLSTLEDHGWEAFRSVLDFHGVEFMTPSEAADSSASGNVNYADAQRDAEYTEASTVPVPAGPARPREYGGSTVLGVPGGLEHSASCTKKCRVEDHWIPASRNLDNHDEIKDN